MIVGSLLLNENWANKNDFTLVTYCSLNIITIKMYPCMYSRTQKKQHKKKNNNNNSNYQTVANNLLKIAFSKSLKMIKKVEITLPKIPILFWCDS
jgi:hypothetical protein